MPAHSAADRLEWVFQRLTPPRRLTPAEVLHHRVVTGGALLGAAVALPAGAVTLAGGSVAGASAIATFAVGCLALLAGARLGAPVRMLRRLGFWLVSAFLVVACLQSPQLHWEQFKWLALIPMLSLFLDDMTPDEGLLQRRVGGLWRGTGLAVLLGLVVIGANRLGWTLTDADIPGPMDTLAGLVDFVLFTVSVAGLISVHAAALRRAQDELRLLRSMLSVCAWCRRIRDEDQGWVEMERYVAQRAEAHLTHGICPDCQRDALADIGR